MNLRCLVGNVSCERPKTKNVLLNAVQLLDFLFQQTTQISPSTYFLKCVFRFSFFMVISKVENIYNLVFQLNLFVILS